MCLEQEESNSGRENPKTYIEIVEDDPGSTTTWKEKHMSDGEVVGVA